MKKIVAALGVAGALVVGTGWASPAHAADPLRVTVCGDIIGFCNPLADVSVGQIVGPASGSLCGSTAPVTRSIGLLPGLPYVVITVCGPTT